MTTHLFKLDLVMSKYIDSDKLIAEFQKRFDICKRISEDDKNALDTMDWYRGKYTAYSECLYFIASLQQEQPEGLHFSPLNRLIQKIPSKNWNDTVNNYAKKLRDCLIKEGYLKDAEVLQGYISYMNGNNVPMATMDEQEQPEVDLEKEYKEWWETRVSGNVNIEHTMEWFMHETARHFYKLGCRNKKV